MHSEQLTIQYFQKLLFPSKSAHAYHTLTTIGNLYDAGATVRFFPGGRTADIQSCLKELPAALGFDLDYQKFSLPVPVAHKGLYSLGFSARTLLSLQRSTQSVIFASSVKEAAWAVKARKIVGKSKKIPLCFEIHHLISKLKSGNVSAKLYELEKKVFLNADCIIFNSYELAKLAEGYLPSPRQSLILPLGYNDRVISAVKRELDPAGNDKLLNLVYLGSLQKGKGVESLIAALEFLPDNYQLTIIGGSSEKRRAELAELPAAIKNKDRLTFTGQIAPCLLQPLLNKCDIFIIPLDTNLDFFAPMKMYEALGFGLPIVASAAPTLREQLEDGVNAIFAKEAGATGLAEAIRQLGSDQELRVRMSQANLQKAVELSSRARAVKLYAVLRELKSI